MIETIKSLLQNTKIRSRLFFTLFLLSIPLFCLLILVLITQNRAIRFGQKEINGVIYNQNVITLIQQYRNFLSLLQTQALNNITIDTTNFKKIQESIQQSQNQLQEINNNFGELLSTGNLLLDIEKNFEIFEKAIHSQNFLESKSSALKTIEQLQLLNTHVGDTSNLILDPDLDSYYLMDITLIKIPSLIQISTQIEIIVMESLELKNISQENRIKLFSLYSELDSILKQILNSYEVSYKYNSSLKEELNDQKKKSYSNLNLYKDEIKSLSDPSTSITDLPKLENFPIVLSVYNQSILDLYKMTYQSQIKLLEKRVSDFRLEQFISISLVLLITGITVFIQYLIVFSITNPLNESVTKFGFLAKGNLKQRIEYKGNDEIGVLANSINYFIEYLTNLLRTISNLTGESKLVFSEISEMTKELNNSTLNQASSTEESAAALEEISSSFNKISSSIEKEATDIEEIGGITDHIAESVTNASKSIDTLRSIVESSAKEVKKGELIISKTVDSMNEIKSAANEISKIILLITEISKQISLLALNASIEAARAGEHGRGFSVVADEISKLSQRTEESVKHIRALISSTNTSVKDGIHNVSTVVDVLKLIIEKINLTSVNAKKVGEEISSQSMNIGFIANSHSQLHNLSEQINTSAKEEQIAISQISLSMNQISNETQLISENLVILIEAGKKMLSLSESLEQTVNQFEL